jgi:exodeoxyribonuclease VII small subunit
MTPISRRRAGENVRTVAILPQEPCRDDYNPDLPEPVPMDRTDSTTPADAPASFEDAQAELDELVRAMETGQMPLDGLLNAYKRGAQLLEFCRSRLDAVEEQVKVLEEGQLKPWTRP